MKGRYMVILNSSIFGDKSTSCGRRYRSDDLMDFLYISSCRKGCADMLSTSSLTGSNVPIAASRILLPGVVKLK